MSTALFLAVVIGIVEALALYLGSEFFLTLMGIPPVSSIYFVLFMISIDLPIKVISATWDWVVRFVSMLHGMPIRGMP